MTTPIEDRAHWRKHREAARAVRNGGGHFHCSQAIGFMAAAEDGEKLAEELGKPCKVCLGILEAAKKQQEKAA